MQIFESCQEKKLKPCTRVRSGEGNVYPSWREERKVGWMKIEQKNFRTSLIPHRDETIDVIETADYVSRSFIVRSIHGCSKFITDYCLSDHYFTLSPPIEFPLSNRRKRRRRRRRGKNSRYVDADPDRLDQSFCKFPEIPSTGEHPFSSVWEIPSFFFVLQSPFHQSFETGIFFTPPSTFFPSFTLSSLANFAKHDQYIGRWKNPFQVTNLSGAHVHLN